MGQIPPTLARESKASSILRSGGKKSAPRFFGLGEKKVPLALFSIWRPPESSDFAQNFTGAPENYLATSLKV